jgi:ribosome-binding protein aMBF1 (putative translation factor)
LERGSSSPDNFEIGYCGSAITQHLVKRVGKLKHVTIRHISRRRDNLVFQLVERNGALGGACGRESLTHREFSSIERTLGEQLLRSIVPAQPRLLGGVNDHNTETYMSGTKTRARDPIDDTIAKQVTKQRKARGVSQRELADQIGVTFQQVQKYESGENRMPISRLIRAARALGCKITDFIPEEDR